MTPTPGERAEIIARAQRFMEMIESGEIVSFVAVYAHGDGSQLGSIAACHPEWAREAMAIVLAQIPAGPSSN